jgi:signal transduction histidine kinase
VLEETLALVVYEMEAQEVSLEREYVSGLPPVPMDREQMKQVFLNLLLNAIQAMEQGGKLKVATALKHPVPGAKRGSFIKISFQDTGRGIPEDVKGKVFEPFYSTKEGGIGLGLSIAQRIVQEHGGEIGLESSPGKGTIFYLTIPYGTQIIEI